jgi:hypothetical protein
VFIEGCRSCARHVVIGSIAVIVPLILKLSTRWTWVVSFRFQLLYPRGSLSWNSLNKRLGGCRFRSVQFEKERYLLLLPWIETQILSFPASNLVTASTMLSRSLYNQLFIINKEFVSTGFRVLFVKEERVRNGNRHFVCLCTEQALCVFVHRTVEVKRRRNWW